MSIKEEIRTVLDKEFKNRKKKNPRYSLRAYALSLGISVSRLSEVLNNKRDLSKTQIEKINAAIGDSWSFHLINTNPYDQKDTFKSDQFQSISNWIYLACLSFLKSKQNEFVSTKVIAKYFNKPTIEMENILNLLFRLNLVSKSSNGWSWVKGPEKTTDQISSKAIRNYHKNMLEEAKHKIDTTPIEERDYSSIVISIDPHKVPKAKEEIKKFRRKLSTFLEDGDQNQVYALNIQLFPLSIDAKKGL